MHHQALSSLLRAGRSVPLRAGAAAGLTIRSTSLPTRAFYATSAPKKAEEASAQSGGSRSKDAAEKASAQSGGSRSNAAEKASENSKGSQEPDNPTPHPKVFNSAVPGTGEKHLSKEQQEEVDRHNADFEEKHDRAAGRADNKVDKSFWSGGGGRDQGPGQ